MFVDPAQLLATRVKTTPAGKAGRVHLLGDDTSEILAVGEEGGERAGENGVVG